ncbi:MAG: ATP-dependent RecD-like DNA helicase [Firmicutes bacterium]|nr:ATP-dependent RecD-like DNA helicase [candidate division NPL-UPA2 bacterium]
MLQIKGTIERVVFYNQANHYSVLRFRLRDNQIIAVVGHLPGAAPGKELELTGEYTSHPQYGKQFLVATHVERAPLEMVGIEKYLGSGLLKGIGPGTARRLVAHFGADTLRVLEYSPERLPEVPGIGEAKRAMLLKGFSGQREVQKAMVFLQGHGITPAFASRIYREYGADTEVAIRKNPYRLADDVFGIGFRTADKLARELGFLPEEPRRLAAGIRWCLREAENSGHCYLPLHVLEQQAGEALVVRPELIAPVVENLVQSRHLVRAVQGDETRIYRTPVYAAEVAVAAKLRDLSRLPVPFLSESLEGTLQAFTARHGITLVEAQREAIASALKHGVTVITGGPGTGKTTLVKALLHICDTRQWTVYLAAPTGRAAKRLGEATGREAKTVHRLLEYTPQAEQSHFLRNEENPLRCDLLVLDESSMMDLSLMYHLLKAVPLGCRLVLVGDVDQLPPVGAGNVLRDIISTGLMPIVRLEVIFRQAKESLIIANAHRINRGEFPYLATNRRDFLFFAQDDPEKVVAQVLEVVQQRLPKLYRYHPILDIQVLTPMRRTITGVDNLNLLLQQALNPPSPGKAEVQTANGIFRLGDKVMQIRNNYTRLVYNGDVGSIVAIDGDGGEITVAYPDRSVVYELTELSELTLAYASTVHKSQGSEYRAVVLPFTTQHYVMLQRNLLYTAITRARELVVLVGSKKALAIAVKNAKVEQRYTGLATLLAQGWLL